MPKRHSSDEIIDTLEAQGFLYVSQKGSHVKFRQTISGMTTTVIVPANKKEVPIGTFRSIVRQSKLDIADFDK
ncbi:MAG TPA: type II toxin-antitoxin system HicA family toxin [Candidatus Paceibacterota bacterium]|nr:type II toxin-antitoxin system HicA family toxin [Candidatus Paceibacterota bacterium]